MMQSNIGQVLGCVSVVNYKSETIFDTFVCYPKPINIINTDEEFSGIDWNDIDPQNGAQLFSKVQAQLAELLRDRIVIGHDIQKDLKVNGFAIAHPTGSWCCSAANSCHLLYGSPRYTKV
jgi:RNA exonuclease 4